MEGFVVTGFRRYSGDSGAVELTIKKITLFSEYDTVLI